MTAGNSARCGRICASLNNQNSDISSTSLVPRLEPNVGEAQSTDRFERKRFRGFPHVLNRRGSHWRRVALQHGRAGAKPRGNGRNSGRTEAHGGFIRELLAEQRCITLAEIQARLAERGVPVSIGPVHRLFPRHGIRRTKKPGTGMSRTGPTS